jgi:protease I
MMAPNKRILIPIPSYGCDPTEVSIPWQLISEKGIDVVFATPDGETAVADSLMLKGERLGIWKPLLQARRDAVLAYQQMQLYPAFASPLSYQDINSADFDGILLPGGHDKGIKEYLESKVLQALVVEFFNAKKPVGAICHGVVLAARSIDPKTQRSVIYDYNTTALLKSQELAAYNLTRWWLKDYYLTYPDVTVEDEVKSVLAKKSQFLSGATPLFRDDMAHLGRGFVVQDRNYLSARWPGDAYNFSLQYIEMLERPLTH